MKHKGTLHVRPSVQSPDANTHLVLPTPVSSGPIRHKMQVHGLPALDERPQPLRLEGGPQLLLRDDEPAPLERDANVALAQGQVRPLALDDVVSQLAPGLRDVRRQHKRLEVVRDPRVVRVLEAVDQRPAGEDGDALEREGVRAEEAGRERDGEPETRVALEVGGVEVQVALAQGRGCGFGSDLFWTWLASSHCAVDSGCVITSHASPAHAGILTLTSTSRPEALSNAKSTVPSHG